MQTIVPQGLLEGVSFLTYLVDSKDGNNVVATTVSGSGDIVVTGATLANRLIAGETVFGSTDASLVDAAVESYSVVSGDTHVTLSQHASASASGVTVTFVDRAIVRLAIAPFSPGPNPSPSDFVEAAFDGYVPKIVAWNGAPARLKPDGNAQVDAGLVSWELAADPVTPQTVVGYYVVFYFFGSGRQVWCFEPLPNLPMMKAGDAIVLSLPLSFPLPGGATVIG